MFCITIAENKLGAVFEKIREGSQYGNFFEIRVDHLENPDASGITEILKFPYRFLFTFRSKREGGARRVGEKKQLEWTLWALKQNFYLVDVEWRLFKKFFHEFPKESIKKVLLSYHNFKKVPSDRCLKKILKEAKKFGIKKVKIVCRSKDFKEVSRLLNLILFAKDLNIELVSFGMGEDKVIKFSRILCLVLGSPFTYVCLPGKKGVAPGQIDILKAKEVYLCLKQI